jgi:catechol 2,3-dioxygenase-like lactoylglutathione lyase family enzyme
MAGGSEPLAPVAPEFFVPDVDASVRFYTDVLGFVVLRQEPDFAVVGLGDAHVLLAHESLTSKAWLQAGPRGVGLNVRIMVDDVDGMYRRAKAGGARIAHEIADRDYGLRDFILADEDGFLLRFASPVRPSL